MHLYEDVTTGEGSATDGLPTTVQIREVGPRDGLQMEAPISFEAKRRLLDSLVAVGHTRIEATAFVSPRAVPSMADAEQVAEYVLGLPGITWSALVVSGTGARRAMDAGIRHLEYVVSAADGHSLVNTRRTTTEAVAGLEDAVDLVHDLGGTCELIVATAWDCPFDGPVLPAQVVDVVRRALAFGVDQICLADTIGTATPDRVRELFDAVSNESGAVPVGAHFHDTRGMGMVNALAAIGAGASMLDASVGGLGGCPFAPGASGNIATEELVYLLDGLGVGTGLSIDAALAATDVVLESVPGAGLSSLARAGLPVPADRSDVPS